MIIRKLGDKKPKILVFQGSPRDKDTCPNMNSKTHAVVEHVIDKWSPFVNFEVIDLSVNQSKKPTIQPCKGCISSAGGYHCHFSCSCYNKGNSKMPDLMYEMDVYEKLKECDAFVVFSPIHWHSLTAQVKTLFDRLVCINQTLDVNDAINLMGKGNIKNVEYTSKLAKSNEHKDLLRNHLEGKYAAFYAHGDDGANDYEGKEMPESYNVMHDPFSVDPRSIVLPYVMQMKYSGIFVPDDLVESFFVNKGVDYYTANTNQNTEMIERADKLMENLLGYLDEKNTDI
jgi:multimeric flavodoxin WrbA